MDRRDLSLGRRFDEVAESYDRYRPRYPSALFDALGEVVGLDGDPRILEVGCGPGVATESLVARGWSVLAVEPGAQLARVAREKFAEERFAVEVSTFDEWDPRGRRFDLLFSAAAYHWVAPEVRWVRAAEVLDDGGHLALAGNRSVAQGSFHEFYEATAGLREEYGVDEERPSPTLDELGDIVTTHGHDVGSLWEALSPQGSDVVAGDLFDAPDVRLYPWSRSYSTTEALGLLATYSRFVAMDGARRAELFARMAALADERFAGELDRYYVCVLALAPRSS